MTTETARAFYARQKWNPGYGHKVKNQGRLVTVRIGDREFVDVEASLARLAATADPAKHYMADVNAAQRDRARSAFPPPAETPTESRPAPPAAQTTPDPAKATTYIQAKTAREVYEAKLSQLDYEERAGKLIRSDLVRAKLAKTFASLRDGLLQIPARLAPVLAAESDATRINALLMSELAQVLEQLTE
jgi:hypothetical protein